MKPTNKVFSLMSLISLEKHLLTISKQSSPDTLMMAKADFIGGVANATIVSNINDFPKKHPKGANLIIQRK